MKVTVPPATVNSVADTWAVMVMTAPLDGLSGVVNSVVVVAADAHAAGPPATNARALNNTGIHRPRDNRREVTLRLSATMVELAHEFQNSNSYGLVRKRETWETRTPDKQGSNSSQLLCLRTCGNGCINFHQLLEDIVRFAHIVITRPGELGIRFGDPRGLKGLPDELLWVQSPGYCAALVQWGCSGGMILLAEAANCT